MKNIFFITLLLSGIAFSSAQSNTAVVSGVIGKCLVWGHPYTLYNNGGASQNISSGITVTVDQNRNIGAVNLAPGGALDFAGGNGITMSGAGGEINCRWDINRNQAVTVVNNNGVQQPSGPNNAYGFRSGVIFTAPYPGNYRWVRVGGWSASVTGAIRRGAIDLLRPNYNSISYDRSIFGQLDGPGCINSTPPFFGPTWKDVWDYSVNPGDVFEYGVATSNTNLNCEKDKINAVIGNAIFFYDN